MFTFKQKALVATGLAMIGSAAAGNWQVALNLAPLFCAQFVNCTNDGKQSLCAPMNSPISKWMKFAECTDNLELGSSTLEFEMALSNLPKVGFPPISGCTYSGRNYSECLYVVTNSRHPLYPDVNSPNSWQFTNPPTPNNGVICTESAANCTFVPSQTPRLG